MKRANWSTYLASLILACACVLLCACIQLKWDNPAKDKMKQLESKPLKKIEVHELFGEPIIGLDEWNVEVYAFPGGMSKYFAIGSVPAFPIIVPEGIYEDNVTGYIMIVYEDDLVKDSDYGSDKGDAKLDAEGFTYLINTGTLLVKNNIKYDFNNRITSSNCNVYVLSYVYTEEQGIYLDNKYIGQPNYEKGYLFAETQSGSHEILLKHINEKSKKSYYNKSAFWGYGFPIPDDWFDKIKIEFQCKDKKDKYFKIIDKDSSWFHKNVDMLMTEIIPEDFPKRLRIIFQTTPNWVIMEDSD